MSIGWPGTRLEGAFMPVYGLVKEIGIRRAQGRVPTLQARPVNP